MYVFNIHFLIEDNIGDPPTYPLFEMSPLSLKRVEVFITSGTWISATVSSQPGICSSILVFEVPSDYFLKNYLIHFLTQYFLK